MRARTHTDPRDPAPRWLIIGAGHLHCARLESRLTGGSVHAEPVRRPWHWSWPLRARLITTAQRGAGPRAGGTSRHGLLTSWLARERPAGQVCRGVNMLQEKFDVRNGRARAGADRMVLLRARRGVGGDAPGPWQGRRQARIAQRLHVGELEPEPCFLGVSGGFHHLAKRTENQLRGSRERSGGASGRAQPAGNAQRARRRLAGLARRAGRGRAKCT